MPPAQSTPRDDRLAVDPTLGVAGRPGSRPEYRGRRRREADLDLTSDLLSATRPLEVGEPLQRDVLPAQGAAAQTPPTFLTRAQPPAAVVGSANVRRAPRHRGDGRTRTLPTTYAPRRRRRLTALAALVAVGAGVGVAAATGALPEQAPTQASAAIGPRTAQAVGAVAADGSRTSSEQSSSAVWATEPDGAFRMVGVSRSQERGPIAGCTGTRPTKHYANGQLPASILCALPFAAGHRLRADAAVRLIRLNEVYKGAFGEDLCLTDSYRSLGSQYSLAERKPGLAARPGTSEHGWGLAVDVCGGPDKPGSTRRAWFLKHAPNFGWDNPSWARPGGSKPEPWHWEFIEGE